MPGRDGTGPGGQGPRTGRGMGRCGKRAGQGKGMGKRVRAAGPEGNCVCPSCGAKVIHRPGIPCSAEKCTNCGNLMMRE